MIVRHGAQFFGDYGGDYAHGKRFTEVDLFLQTEFQAADWRLYAGDEYAYPARNPTKAYQLQASRAVSDANYVFQPKTVHHVSPALLTGRALVNEVEVTAPHDVEYRGYQTYWKEGPSPRRESPASGGGA
jgi:hypothetical protein